MKRIAIILGMMLTIGLFSPALDAKPKMNKPKVNEKFAKKNAKKSQEKALEKYESKKGKGKDKGKAWWKFWGSEEEVEAPVEELLE